MTEVSPEAFSHCPSVDTLVTDPDSAAFQLFEGMGDIKKENLHTTDATPSIFGFTDLGKIAGTFKDEVALEGILSGMIPQQETLLFAKSSDTLSGGFASEALIRCGSSFISASVESFYSDEDNMFEETRMTMDAATSYSSTSALPTWIRNVINGVRESPSYILYKAADYSSDATVDSTGAVGYGIASLNRYSIHNSGQMNSAYFAPSANGGFPGYKCSSGKYYLKFATADGLYVLYKATSTTSNGNRYLAEMSSSTATVNSAGTKLFCDLVLRLSYSTATSPFGSLDTMKTYYLVLPPKLKVNWDANGGAVTDSSWFVPTKTWEADGGILLTRKASAPPTPSRDNYTFKGWNTKQDGTGTNISNSFSTTKIYDEGVTYYAQWERDTYTVQYKNKAGTNVLKTDTVNRGDSYSLWGSPTASAGYTAKGWNTSSGQTAAASGYAFNTSKTNWKNKGETLTLYLAEAANTYYVDYYGNGNTGGSTARSTHTYDTASRLNANGYTKTGHNFQGWAETSTGSAKFADQGYVRTGTSTANGVYNLYAKWLPNVLTVKYNANGGTGTMADTTHTYGTASTLRANGFTAPKGKYFNGWKTADGTAYSAGQNMTYHGSANGTTITLYAQWAYTNYSVTYNANGGTLPNGTANPTYYNIDTATFNLVNPTRTGFSFQGWKTASNLSGNSMTQVVKGSQTNYTIYASWGVGFNYYVYAGELDHSVIQEGYGSSTAYTSVTDKTPTSITNTNRQPAGWTLHQWSRNATSDSYNVNLGGNAYAYSSTNANNYYAKWKADIYQNLNYGGAKDTYLTTVYAYGKNPTATYKPADPAVRTGYTFDGWNVEYPSVALTNDNSKYKNTTITFKGAATIVAQWSANTYNVRYNPNGGKGTMASSVHTYDTAKNLTKNAFTRDGYTYNGWNTQANGTGTAYKDEHEVLNLASTTGANVDLYAQWDANDYKIRFDANGGAGGITGPIDVTFDSALPKLDGNWKPVAPEGYEFNGWWDTSEKTGGNQYYGPNGEATQTTYNLVADDITLYARWSRLPFHAITLKDERLDVKDGSKWFWPPTKGYTPDDPNNFPVDGTMDHLIRIVAKDNKIADLTDPIFSDEDYEFLGYFDKKQGEEGAIQKIDADGNLKTDEPVTKATVWYAHWTRHGATVKLEADYGEMVSEDIVQGTDRIDHVSFGKDFATPTGEDTARIEAIEKTPTRVGYTFMGYYTDENPELSTDDVKTNNFKGTRWIYGEGEEDVSAGTLVANEWPSEEDWNKLGLDDKEDSNTIVLYAAWQLDDCIVEFDIESNLEDDTERVYVPEGSTALQDRIWHYNKNMDEALPVPGDATFTRNGYTFGGWYYVDGNEDEVRVSSADGTPEDVLLPWKNDVEKVTLYAYWAPRTYALEFHPAFPGDEGVEEIYEGEKSIKGIKYDDDLTLVSPDFGAYDFAGWYVGVSDGLGSWEASDVPFSDWTLRSGEEVKGLHTTDMVKQDDAAYVTYEGRFTPHDPLVDQTYDAASPKPAVIHVVAKWEKPVPRYIHFYAGLPEESLDASTRDYDPEYYKFATAYPIDPTYLPNVGKDGWKCKGWVEVESEEEALEYLKSGYVGDEKDPGVTSIEAKTTRAAYKDLYFVAKWTICPLSVTLVTEENEDGTYVKGTDGLVDADSWNATPKTDSLYAKAYDVRQAAFTLPNLSRKGYDFLGWVRQGSDDTEPRRDYPVNPADQAKLEANHDLVFEPVFEEIEYTIYLEPNGGGLERQERKAKFTELFDFSASYPVALHTGSVFKAWATKKQKPMEDIEGTYREFGITASVPMSCETEGMEESPFFLTDLTDDVSRTIYLYGIWFGEMYNAEVPLTVNMAVDPETGDVVAAKSTLKARKGNEDKVYTVESLRYEPVSDERGVPFEGATNVYFSVYPGLTFQNDSDAYYFLQKDKVGDKGAVTYTNAKGELVTSTPLLIELGRASATPKLFTKTKSTSDANEVTLDSMTGETSGFYSFSADEPLDVYCGLHFEGEKRDWVNVLKRFAYGSNSGGWELPENDAGYQRYTGLPDDEGRRLGWSSDRVDIAKVRYTLSMQTKAPTEQ